MKNRYSTLLLIFAAVAIAATGCDQGTQIAEPGTANRYIISMKKTAVGDAGDVNIQDSSQKVIVPDTVAYAVQGFTINKTYNWMVNGSDVPVESRSDSTYVWKARKGEFMTAVYAQGDPLTDISLSSMTTNTIKVNSPDDNINAEEITVTSVVPTVGGQVARLGSYATLTSLLSGAGLVSTLEGSGPFTLLAPRENAISALDPVPTQATDSDEPASSSVAGDLLKYHVIPSNVGSDGISDGMSAGTLFGNQTLSFGVSGNTITINGSAQVVRPDFPATNGSMHGIDAPLLPATASVDFTDRTVDTLSAGGPTTNPDTLTVDGSFIPEGGGFIVLHDSTELQNQGAIASTIGVSAYISGNSVANKVKIPVDEDVSSTTTIGAMPHKDTDDDQTYDFATSGGSQDTPYTLEGSPILDFGVISIN